MPRVATCKDCGARFKVPDTTTATRGKCKKCGGVVEIPGDAGGAPASAPKSKPRAKAAPKRSAPAAPTRSKGAAGKATRKASDDGTKTSSRSAGRKGRAAGGRKARGKGKGEPKKKSPVGVIVGVVVVAGALGAGGFFLFGPGLGEESTPAPDVTADGETLVEDGTAVAAGTNAESPDSPIDTGGVPGSATLTAADLAGIEKAPVGANTPADTAAGAPDAPEEPLDPILGFTRLPPAPGSTDEELAQWLTWITEIHIDGLPPRRSKTQREGLDAADIVLATPAYINALKGMDMADTIDVRNAFSLIDEWQKRVGYTPRFFFSGDGMETIDINKRVKVVDEWIKWWISRSTAKNNLTAEENLDEYRTKMLERLKETQVPDGG